MFHFRGSVQFITFFLLFLSFEVFSGFTYQKTVTNSSLYQENPVDPYSFNSKLSYVYLPVKEQRNISFLTYFDNGEGKLVSGLLNRFSDDIYAKSSYLNAKAAINESLFQTRVDFNQNNYVVLDLNIKGFLNSVFEATGGADCLAYDGSFFFGPEIQYNGNLVLRAGLHHLSGHYGDEVLESFEELYSINRSDYKNIEIRIDGKDYKYYSLSQYVRDNNFLLGLQYGLPLGFNCYFEYSQPLHKAFVRPFFEAPANLTTSTMESTENVWENLARNEGVSDKSNLNKYSEQYKEGIEALDKMYVAARIHTGFTWSYSWKNAELFAGFDFQAHQDGQTKHTLGGYDKNNSWEYELTMGTGLFFDAVGLEIQYHIGRFPALNLFPNRVNALYVAVVLR